MASPPLLLWDPSLPAFLLAAIHTPGDSSSLKPALIDACFMVMDSTDGHPLEMTREVEKKDQNNGRELEKNKM